MERTNIRYLDQKFFGDTESGAGKQEKFMGREFEELRNRTVDKATIDVSFISLSKVVPAVMAFLRDQGKILALIEPQFEVGKGHVGKGGVIKDEDKRLMAVDGVRKTLESLGLQTLGIFESPVKGQKGNIEYFISMKKEECGR